MQDDCLDVSNKPFYKRRKQLKGALPLGPQNAHMALIFMVALYRLL